MSDTNETLAELARLTAGHPSATAEAGSASNADQKATRASQGGSTLIGHSVFNPAHDIDWAGLEFREKALSWAVACRATVTEADETVIARASTFERFLRGEVNLPRSNPFAGDDITHVSHHQV